MQKRIVIEVVVGLVFAFIVFSIYFGSSITGSAINLGKILLLKF